MRDTIQKLYTSEEFFNQAQEFFNKEGFIQLQDFFNSSSTPKNSMSKFINSKEINSLFVESYSPLIERKQIFETSKTPSNLLEFVEFFKSKSFIEYIEQVIGFSLQFSSLEISKFAHKCFELIHDSKITDSMLIDVYFFITQDDFDSILGGDKVYTTFDEELFYITPQHNTLTCVFRDDTLRKYTKYINSLAKDKEYVQIHAEFEILGDLEDSLL